MPDVIESQSKKAKPEVVEEAKKPVAEKEAEAEAKVDDSKTL